MIVSALVLPMRDPIDLREAGSNTCDRCATDAPDRCRDVARPADLKTREAVIRPRIRKLIGTVALLALVVVWSLFAMALAQIVLVRSNGLLDFAYYAVAGLGWVLPAMPLISWMSRGDEPGRKS
jgi:hypothetical protein